MHRYCPAPNFNLSYDPYILPSFECLCFIIIYCPAVEWFCLILIYCLGIYVLINILVCFRMPVFDPYILPSRSYLFDPYVIYCSRTFLWSLDTAFFRMFVFNPYVLPCFRILLLGWHISPCSRFFYLILYDCISLEYMSLVL